MPTRIVSRKVIEEVVVEHKCLLEGGAPYRTHATAKGELYWSNMPISLKECHCYRCAEKLPRNISEVEETP